MRSPDSSLLLHTLLRPSVRVRYVFGSGIDNNMRCAARLTWRCDPVGSLRGQAYWKIECTYSLHIHAVNALSYRRWHVMVRRGVKREEASSSVHHPDMCGRVQWKLVIEFRFLKRVARWLGRCGSNRGGVW